MSNNNNGLNCQLESIESKDDNFGISDFILVKEVKEYLSLNVMLKLLADLGVLIIWRIAI